MFCLNCNVQTKNPKFCSKSCAATYNNKKFPKRSKKPFDKSCCLCDTKISYNRKFCNDCLQKCPIHNEYRKIYNSGKKQCVKCTTIHQSRHRRNKILKLKEMSGNKCQICNYSKSIRALHFHHLNPSTKEFTISHGVNRSFKRMQNEASKCILICGNCHSEVHEGITVVTGIEPAISSSTD